MTGVLDSVDDNMPADVAPVRRGQRQYREFTSTLDRNTELKTLIKQMEAYYDAQLDSEDDSSSSTKKPAATTQLSPEIERFLSEVGGKLDSDPDE